MTTGSGPAFDARLLALGDRYRVERELGAGGMATVYLAEDLKHRRRVAIKVLRPDLAASLGPERFLREIETTASLRHPHILPLYDSGSVPVRQPGSDVPGAAPSGPRAGPGEDEGAAVLFYVMPYVEGETLRDRLTRERQLPIDDALQIAREVSDALSYAHSRGIVHRDVKPENILLESGHAVVADFGIAKAIRDAGSQSITGTGISVGTPSYMSPEQAAGETNLDGRSDLYALGCVLYEMLAGQAPFTGPNAESIIRQHMVAEPTPIATLRPAVPASVIAALGRALAKNPADRFNPVAQFADALRSGDSVAALPTVPRVETRRSRRVMTIAAAAIVVAAAAALALWRRAPAGAPADSASVAVLPFADLSADHASAYLGDGLAETLTSALGKVDGLAVAGKNSAFSLRDKAEDVQLVGRQLGVATILEGSIQRAGDRLRVTAQLIRAADRRVLWSDVFDRAASDIFAVQDDLSRAVVSALRLRMTPATTSVAGGTQNPAAYEAYMRGRFHWNKRTTDDMVRAADYFKQAIAHDSAYALAWSGLADSYVLFVPNEYNVPGINEDSILTLAEVAARRALALTPTLGEAYSSLGEILEYRLKWTEATDAFERGVRLSPGYATGHQWYGYNLMATDRWDDAIRETEQAYRLDPLSQVIVLTLGFAYDGADRYEDASPLYAKGMPPDSPPPSYALGFAFTHELGRGRLDSAAVLYRQYLLSMGKDSAFALRLERRLVDSATRASAVDEIGRLDNLEAAASAYRWLEGDDAAIAFVESIVGTSRVKNVVPFALNGVIGPKLRANARMRAALAKLDYPPGMFASPR